MSYNRRLCNGRVVIDIYQGQERSKHCTLWTPAVTAAGDDVFPSSTTCWFLSARNVGSRIGSCLCFHSVYHYGNLHVWLPCGEVETCQKPWWRPKIFSNRCQVQLPSHVWWWWAVSHEISFSGSLVDNYSESCYFPEFALDDNALYVPWLCNNRMPVKLAGNWQPCSCPVLEQKLFFSHQDLTLFIWSLTFKRQG